MALLAPVPGVLFETLGPPTERSLPRRRPYGVKLTEACVASLVAVAGSASVRRRACAGYLKILRCLLRGCLLRWGFVFLLALFASPLAQAQSEGSREYQIKAAFLYNFVQFVKWPGTTFSSSDAPFCIGILGDDPFGSILDDTFQGESINGHRFILRRSPRVEELKNCQVIFICDSEESRVDAILSQLNSQPILTVSEVPDFAGKGGDIEFYLSNGKVRFEINPQSAQQCGLRISSQLLSLGKIVAP